MRGSVTRLGAGTGAAIAATLVLFRPAVTGEVVSLTW